MEKIRVLKHSNGFRVLRLIIAYTLASVLGILLISCAPKTRTPELKGPPAGPERNQLLEQLSDPANLESLLFEQKVRLRDEGRVDEREIEECPEGEDPVPSESSDASENTELECETPEERAQRLETEIRDQAEESLEEADRIRRENEEAEARREEEAERATEAVEDAARTAREEAAAARALQASQQFQRFSAFLNQSRDQANRLGSTQNPIQSSSPLRLFFNIPVHSLRYYRFQGEVHDFCSESDYCPVLINVPLDQAETEDEREYFSEGQIFYVKKSQWRSVFPNETRMYLEIEPTTVAVLSLGQSIVGIVGSRNGRWFDTDAIEQDLFFGFSVSDQHLVIARREPTVLNIYQQQGDRVLEGVLSETPWASSQFTFFTSYGSPEDIDFIRTVPEELWDTDLLALKPQVQALLVAASVAAARPAVAPTFEEGVIDLPEGEVEDETGIRPPREPEEDLTPQGAGQGLPTNQEEGRSYINQLLTSVPSDLPDSVFLGLQENHNRQIQCILLQNNEVRSLFDIFPRSALEFTSGQIDLNQLNDAEIYDLNNLVLLLDILPQEGVAADYVSSRPFFQSPIIQDGTLRRLEHLSPEGQAVSYQLQNPSGEDDSLLIFLRVEQKYLPLFVNSEGAHYMNCVTNDNSLRVGSFQHPPFPNEDDSSQGRIAVYRGAEPVRSGNSIIEMSAILKLVLEANSPYRVEDGKVFDSNNSEVSLATGTEISQLSQSFSFYPAEENIPVRIAIAYRANDSSMNYYPLSYVQPKLIPIRNGDGNVRVVYRAESDSQNLEEAERIINGIQQEISQVPGMYFYRYTMLMDYFPKNCISKAYEQRVLEREGPAINGYLRRKEMLGVCLTDIQIEFPENLDIMVQTDTGENVPISEVVDVSQGHHPEILTPPAQ